MRAYTKVGEKVATEKFGIQATLIIGAMSETEPRTTTEITNAIKERLVTRQDPERVTAFYLSVWKKKGIVKLHEVGSPSEVASTSSATTLRVVEPRAHDEWQPGDAGGTGVTALSDGTLPPLNGMKLSQAVLEVIKFLGGSASPDKIVNTMNAHGYEFKLNQVNSALQALEARQAVSRGEGDQGYEFRMV